MSEFEHWKNKKKILIDTPPPAPRFNVRDIWYCSVGVNVGYEINGHHELVERPVLVCKKYNNSMFFGIPLTTQQKQYDSRFPTKINDRDGDYVLDQVRTYSADRLNRKIRRIGYKEFDAVRKALREFLELDVITAPQGGCRD